MESEVDKMKSIASQLSCPSGEAGLDMAEQMNQSNHGMTANTIHHLELKANEHVLEVGPGNAKHLSEIMLLAPSIKYTGLEISVDMKKEAERLNVGFINQKQAQFHLYSGEKFPFEEAVFDKIMTVNTLYFWENPSATLNEIYRVLKPGGACIITYSHKDFMKTLPFTQYGFQLYNDEDVLALLERTIFKEPQVFLEIETVKSKHGEMITRPYSILRVTK
ncbi:hypothetical protein GCM10011506_10010 [Marivirga lumbricoides]|uniref:Methyltransferase type 11 domain-containing protein n=1 Tax=Marivirga lumbricoides TaxID=1046115 RepID=A0ABQ1LTR6_9BACT|nr:hypothetical protein GCM10011506_10010 [Marivirga lumbricoides]